MKAGLLLPRSDQYPSIAADITVALRHCTKLYGNENAVSFVSENIGFGGSEKDIYDKAEKLLLLEDVDVLIAYIDMKVMSIIEPLMYVTGKLLIVINTGANFPEKKIPQPGILYLTQQYSFLSRLTGNVAGNGDGIYATTFYDCGYMHGAAMIEGFMQNNGNIVFNYINKDRKENEFNIRELITFLDGHPGKEFKLLCLMDEKPAALFYKALNDYVGAERLILFVSPRMLTATAIADGAYGFPVEGYTSWLPTLSSKENKTFTDLYTATPKKEPSIFSLSGWEAGLVLNELLRDQEKIKMSSAAEKISFLCNIPLHSPRGILRIDSNTNFYTTDTVYECRLAPGENRLQITGEETNGQKWNDLVNGQNDLPASGWTNTYLCY